VTSYHSDDGVTCAYSTDGGATWDESAVSAYAAADTNLAGAVILNWDDAHVLPVGASVDHSGMSDLNTASPSFTKPYGSISGQTQRIGGGNGGGNAWGNASGYDTNGNIVPCSIVGVDFGSEKTIRDARFDIRINAASQYYGVAIRYYDGSKTLIPGVSYSSSMWSGAYGNSTAWETKSHSSTIAGVRYVAFEVWCYNGGNATYIDNVYVNEGTLSGSNHQPVISMSPRLPGTAYTIAFDASGDSAAFQTDDYGATWTQRSSPNLNCGARMGSYLERPYADASKFFLTWAFGASPYSFQLMRVQGTTQTVGVTPSFSGTYYSMPGIGSKELAIARTNKNRLVLIGRSGGGATTGGVFTTLNGGGSWAARLGVSSANAIWRIVELGTDGTSVYLVGEDTLYYSSDFLAHTDDRSGNLPALAAGEPLKLFRWG